MLRFQPGVQSFLYCSQAEVHRANRVSCLEEHRVTHFHPHPTPSQSHLPAAALALGEEEEAERSRHICPDRPKLSRAQDLSKDTQQLPHPGATALGSHSGLEVGRVQG